ncbi:MAG: hypothetical protein IPJ43_03350 [Saprospiraceae bacterium]|nr:hypothetical protein [Saprospiraceae bacterium]
MKQDCPAVNIPLIQLWNRDTTLNKLKAILRCKYHPRQELIQQIAREIFFEEFFGSKDDLAEPLLELMVWHQNRNWCLLNLENSDSEKANALEAMTHLSRKRYWEYTSPALNLQLIYKQPIIVPFNLSYCGENPSKINTIFY